MPIPRTSTRVLLFAMILIAIDLATVREIWGNSAYPIVYGVFGAALMTHLLAIVCYRSFSSGTISQPFLVGFVSAGALAVFTWFSFCVFSDESRLAFLVRFMNGVMRRMPGIAALARQSRFEQRDMLYVTALQIMILGGFSVLTAVPQLALALAGGWLARRFVSAAHASVPPEPQVV